MREEVPATPSPTLSTASLRRENPRRHSRRAQARYQAAAIQAEIRRMRRAERLRDRASAQTSFDDE